MLHVICTVYQRTEPLKVLISSFLLQTNPDWRLYIVHDGPAPLEIKNYMVQYIDMPCINFIETDSVTGSFGHPNRQLMLKKIAYSHKDFILITNDDNYYVPKFVEYMLRCAMARVGTIGMVYCDTVHSYLDYRVLKTRLEVNYIDMGSFIVRADIAKKVGFNHIHFAADGQFAIECAQFCRRMKLTTTYLDKPLFVHN